MNRESRGYDFSEEETRKKLMSVQRSEKDKVFVAVAGKEVAGYIHICSYDVLYMPHMKNILGVGVLPSYRRQGIGTALLEAAEAWAREEKAWGVRLVSGAEREVAHTFYRRHGYDGEKKQINFKKIFKGKQDDI